MCVIIYSVNPIPGSELAAACRVNPDGVAWSTWGADGWEVPHKAAPDEGDGTAYRAAVAALSRDGLPAGSVFWSRIATGSRCDVRNCQPFPVCGGRAWLWHNGIIGPSTPDESDTRRLAAALAAAPWSRAEWLLDTLAHRGAGRFLIQWAGDPSPRLYGRWDSEAEGETWRSNRNHLPRPFRFEDWDEWERGGSTQRHGLSLAWKRR